MRFVLQTAKQSTSEIEQLLRGQIASLSNERDALQQSRSEVDSTSNAQATTEFLDLIRSALFSEVFRL